MEMKFFQNQLLKWFETNQRIYPWRLANLSPYQIIISEILLQRTKADTVLKFYNKFLMEFPDWRSLTSASLTAIEEYLKPIGLYRQRARRLQNLATYMVEHNDNLPQERRLLELVPFMGQYIANAVELLIYKRNSPLLDVNMARVLERYFGKRKLADIRYDPYLQKLASDIVNHRHSKELNWAILDFAALICKARKPICSSCPVSSQCFYFQSIVSCGGVDDNLNG